MTELDDDPGTDVPVLLSRELRGKHEVELPLIEDRSHADREDSWRVRQFVNAWRTLRRAQARGDELRYLDFQPLLICAAIPIPKGKR